MRLIVTQWKFQTLAEKLRLNTNYSLSGQSRNRCICNVTDNAGSSIVTFARDTRSFSGSAVTCTRNG